jgi:hypothetical protein
VLAALGRWVSRLDSNARELHHFLAEALWVHQWLNVVNVSLLTRQLALAEPMARAAATRVLCLLAGSRSESTRSADGARRKDEHPLVRLEAVRAASFFTGRKAVDVALEILNHETDYYLTYTLEETMRALSPSPADVKDPRALQFVLNRLSNAELAAGSRARAGVRRAD